MKFDLVLLAFGLGLIGSTVVSASTRSYDGYKVYRVSANTKAQFDILVSLYDGGVAANFWTQPAFQAPTDIMIPNGSDILNILEANSIPYWVLIEDVQKMADAQLVESEFTRTEASPRLTWTAYNRFGPISSWLDELAQNYSDHVTLRSIGSSSEGRDLKMIVISTYKGPAMNRTSIFMDAGCHAREWISPAIVTYFINELVTKSEQYAHLLDHIDFYVLPVSNPDGYEYTHTTDRMWRKTRSVNPGSTCRGTDPNRNYDIFWGGVGSTTNPCGDTYQGTAPFSAPETAAIRDFVTENVHLFKAYFNFHSYAQAWLIPYAWTDRKHENHDEIMAVGTKAIDALRAVHGTRYSVGPTATVLYFHSGAAQDWTMDAGIKYTFTPELRDTGTYGFLLPANQILPAAQETWAAVQAVADHVIQEFGQK